MLLPHLAYPFRVQDNLRYLTTWVRLGKGGQINHHRDLGITVMNRSIRDPYIRPTEGLQDLDRPHHLIKRTAMRVITILVGEACRGKMRSIMTMKERRRGVIIGRSGGTMSLVGKTKSQGGILLK